MAFISSTPLATCRGRSSVNDSVSTSKRNWVTNCAQSQANGAPDKAVLSRRAFLNTAIAATTSLALSSLAPSIADTTPADVQYNYVKKGSGPAPEVGDLVGIRFKGAYNGVVFDNLFESTDPYFYRAGSGTVLKGIDEAVLSMKVGDVIEVTLPGEKAFGPKGRRASAGKPSIPPNASISYTIELTTIPGREDELLQGIEDAEIESSE